MADNPLTDALTPSWRKRLYVTYAGTALVVGGTQAFYLAASIDQPLWLTGALGVLAYLAIPFGATAASNITTPED